MNNVLADILKKLFDMDRKIDFFSIDRRFATVMFYNIFIGFATSVLMYANKMSSISTEVIESAHLDGASGIKEFMIQFTFPNFRRKNSEWGKIPCALKNFLITTGRMKIVANITLICWRKKIRLLN